jgi:hypothetical protein
MSAELNRYILARLDNWENIQVYPTALSPKSWVGVRMGEAGSVPDYTNNIPYMEKMFAPHLIQNGYGTIPKLPPDDRLGIIVKLIRESNLEMFERVSKFKLEFLKMTEYHAKYGNC